MNVSRKVPLSLVLGLAAAVLIDTVLQIFWKTAVLKLPETADSVSSMVAMFQEPLFIVVICIMTLQFIVWMMVLNQADLSFAQPFTALSYVSVGMLSAIFLGESMDRQQMLGVAFVMAGVWFISRTDYVTEGRGGKGAEGQRPIEHNAKSSARAGRDLVQEGGA